MTSPCVKVCKMEGSLCKGCFRTIEEITNWKTLSDQTKIKVCNIANTRRVLEAYKAGLDAGWNPGPHECPVYATEVETEAWWDGFGDGTEDYIFGQTL